MIESQLFTELAKANLLSLRKIAWYAAVCDSSLAPMDPSSVGFSFFEETAVMPRWLVWNGLRYQAANLGI